MKTEFWRFPECKNLSLYWEKYAFFEFGNNSQQNKGQISLKVLGKMRNIDINSSIEYMKERRNYLKEKFEGKLILDDDFEVNGRLLVGSGSPSILEVGMTFSRNYGVPIIPSSAIKGCFSHYCKNANTFNDEEFKLIFGEDLSNSQPENICGKVIFLDAIPISKVEFGLDIVNNHFQKYYMNGDVPNDWYNPVPVTYITITKGVFKFTVIATDKISSELSSRIRKEFIEMLNAYGIGSKTNYGYGRFKQMMQ